MAVRHPHPRCVVCGDARGTRWMCPECAADPANDGWREASRQELSLDEIGRVADRAQGHGAARATDLAGAPNRAFTRVERGVAVGILVGETPAQTAERLGISPRRVEEVRKMFTRRK